MHTSSSSSSKPLKRGKACLTCRFLKIKCDGARPICGPCHRHPKDDPCEYADGPGRSRTRVLEDQISRLEARLREYENPDETPSVSLHNPYSPAQSSEGTGLHLTVPHLPFLKGEPLSGHPSPSSPYTALSPSPSSPPSATSNALKTSAIESEEPSLPMIRNMLDALILHASSIGFFLDPSQFCTSAILPKPIGDHSRPTPGLLRSVYLIGAHLCGALYTTPDASAYRESEHAFLLSALRETAVDLSTSHPQRYIHTIQAETLLSYYFFRAGKIIEAKRHASSAASLVLACGFHRLRSSSWDSSSSAVALGPSGSTPLPESRNPVEEGERINGFWTVFTLYRNLAAAVNSASDICGVFDAPGMQVDTPWPMDMESYREHVLPPVGASTVWNYLNHVQSQTEEYERSMTTLVTKSSILFHQAVFLAAQYNPNISHKDSQAFIAAFQSLTHLLGSTKAQLEPLPSDLTSPTTKSLYLSYALLYGATIKLHEIYSYSDSGSRQACVDAAKAILKPGLELQHMGCVNPILGTLWTLACQILIDEVVRIRQEWPGEADFLLGKLNTGFSTLSFFATSSDLMSEYYSKVRRLYDSYHWNQITSEAYDEKGIFVESQNQSQGSSWSPGSTISSLEGDGGSDHGSGSSGGAAYQLHSYPSTPMHPELSSGLTAYPHEQQYYTTPRYMDHYSQPDPYTVRPTPSPPYTHAPSTYTTGRIASF